MSEILSRKSDRLTRKKKKLAALLELTELNDKDRMQQNKNLGNENLDDNGGKTNPIDSKKKGERKGVKREIDEEREEEVPDEKRQKAECESEAVLESSKSDYEEKTHEAKMSSNYKMSEEEYKKLKKELRDRKKMLKVTPRILLNEAGNNAAVGFVCCIPLFISDIQHFIMYSQLGHNAPAKARWCDIEKFNRISHTVILIIEGLSAYDVVSNESSCPNFADLNFKVQFLSPFNYDGFLIEELTAVPLTRSQMVHLQKTFSVKGVNNKNQKFRVLRSLFPIEKKESNNTISDKETGNNNLENTEASSNDDQFSRVDLLLSAWQMVEEGYPVPLSGNLQNRYADFVMTKDEYTYVKPNSPMWAVDCEMCMTSTKQNELTRISIVDENFKTVYDTLVKPHNKIINYLTKYSGITKEMMKNVTKTLEDVQEDLRKLLPSDVILVGQSLQFDLIAMKMMHPYVIDTSVIFNMSGLRARKTKLSVLSLMFLNEEIQAGHGHDSIEDSSTALKLVKLKLQNSIEFGDAVLSGPLTFDKKHVLKQNNNKERNKEKVQEEIQFTSLFGYVTRPEGKYASVIAKESILSTYEPYIKAAAVDEKDLRVEGVAIESNMAAIEKTCSQAATQSFVTAHLKLNDNESVHDVNRWCGDIYKSLEYNSLFAVMLAGTEGSDARGAFMFTVKQSPLHLAR
ncbi:RNA exonuclease 1 [Nilaparvata lugens]|uniref:RNA exonuclease 1 n=1 Tax=Nilaparvata lugens TaxID=108931 RepID=UPI00193D0ED6|nr:RNA exonuclease 1 [Nilaparvata lugens]